MKTFISLIPVAHNGCATGLLKLLKIIPARSNGELAGLLKLHRKVVKG